MSQCEERLRVSSTFVRVRAKVSLTLARSKALLTLNLTPNLTLTPKQGVSTLPCMKESSTGSVVVSGEA